jgi:4-amino-4-deoxychorismate lyase
MESTLRVPVDTKLIETFGWVPGQGYPLLDLHLQRLEHSARALGFKYDRHAIWAALGAHKGDVAMRCRLTVGRDGRFDVTRAPMPNPVSNWVVQIAQKRLNSTDPWLLHKTTHRMIYDDARAEMPPGVDELIFLNERDEICEGTITNVFVKTRAGVVVTPALSSGCLPGIYRGQLLANGECQEAFVTLRDLASAQWIGVGNALRGGITAEIHGLNDVENGDHP